jgi:hypothetical protein
MVFERITDGSLKTQLPLEGRLMAKITDTGVTVPMFLTVTVMLNSLLAKVAPGLIMLTGSITGFEMREMLVGNCNGNKFGPKVGAIVLPQSCTVATLEIVATLPLALRN